MRILHTADWHLGDRLGRIDRTGDLRKAVERIGTICIERNVDVLLVAGDLFSELARPDNLRETIAHWQLVFEGFLKSGGTILTLTGNHDNENFCRTLANAMNLANPSVGCPGDIVPNGRLYLATEPMLLKLKDRRDGFLTQFVLMPYPTAARYFRDNPTPKYTSPAEKNARLMTAFLEELRRIQRLDCYEKESPTVLAAHVHVHGATFGSSLFRMNESDDVVIRPDEAMAGFTYVALGHIHKAQTIGGLEHVRYSGSIEAMDLGEANDAKSVTLVEINEQGLKHPINVIPIPATPIRRVVIENPKSDFEELQRRHPEPCNDLASLEIRYEAGVDSLEEILLKLDKMFPRWYARKWRETGELTDRLTTGEIESQSAFEDVVREYVRNELQNHSEEERREVMRRLDQLLASE